MISDFIAIQKRSDNRWHIWTDSIENHFPAPSCGDHRFSFDTQAEALSGASELFFNLEGVPYWIVPLPDQDRDPIDLAIEALEAVEWQKHRDYLVPPWCPWCKVIADGPHKPDCLRQRALRVLRGTRKEHA